MTPRSGLLAWTCGRSSAGAIFLSAFLVLSLLCPAAMWGVEERDWADDDLSAFSGFSAAAKTALSPVATHTSARQQTTEILAMWATICIGSVQLSKCTRPDHTSRPLIVKRISLCLSIALHLTPA